MDSDLNRCCAFFQRGWICAAVVVIAVLSVPQPCSASFIVLAGNDPVPPSQLVLLENGSVGMTVQGTTNQSGDIVLFESPSQSLTNQGAIGVQGGAGLIEDSITISLANPGLSFSGMVFSAFMNGMSGGSLTVVVNGFDSNGDPVMESITEDTDSNPLSLGTGQNFFTIAAEGGQRITSVEIVPNLDSAYVRLQNITISNLIPEPTSAILFGIGLMLAHAAVRRRR